MITERSVILALLLALAAVAIAWTLARKKRRLAERNVARLLDENAARLRQLDEQRLNLEAIVSNMAEGILVVDAKSIIRLVNPALLGLFALREEPIGRTVIEALREASIEEITRTALATGQPQNAEISVRPPGQSPRFFAVSAAPTHERGVIMVFHDITRLRELEEMRRDFVANVSHELRTPLAIFQGYIETLLDYPEMERVAVDETLKIMERHSHRLNALVEDLLTLARLESGRAQLDLQPLAVDAFFQKIERDWQPIAQERLIALLVEPSENLTVLADEFRLEQVVANLLDNALKYTPAPGTVTLSARRDGDLVALRVADTGAGIAAADLPHIFERFYRVEKGRARETGGTGLGLSIVKHIAAQHGGSVEAESKPGHGTTIIVRLPASSLG